MNTISSASAPINSKNQLKPDANPPIEPFMLGFTDMTIYGEGKVPSMYIFITRLYEYEPFVCKSR